MSPSEKTSLPAVLRLVLLTFSVLLYVVVVIGVLFLKILLPGRIKLPRRMTASGRFIKQ